MNHTAIRAERSICVEARFSHLHDLVALLDLPSLGHGVASRARLAVEELFANSIHHGYGGESASPVWLAVECADGRLTIRYADAAPEFNPFEDLPEELDGSPVDVDTHRVGGLGRILTYQMARHRDYRRENDRNIVTLEYELATPA